MEGNTYVHILMCIGPDKINNNTLGCLQFDWIEKNCPSFKIPFFGSMTSALQNFQVEILMIKWHNAQFVGICMVFTLFLSEYLGILVGNNKRRHMSKVLNCECSSPSIDDYIKYKLCGPTTVTSFSIMASILQLIHSHSKRNKPLKYLISFVHHK
jgi:hypothetical protein